MVFCGLALNFFAVVFSPGALQLKPMADDVTRTAKANQAVIFSWAQCPYCDRAKRLLTGLTKDVAVYEVDCMSNGNKLHTAVIEATGHETVPVVFVGGQFVGGFAEVDALHKQGRLQKLLMSS